MPAADDLAPPAPIPALRTRGLRLLRHLAYSLAIGGLIAVFLSLLFRQHFGITLLYSACISVACSLSIDGLRQLASAWVQRGRPATSGAEPDWPGWGWMIACLLLGTPLGVSLGAELANLIIGGRHWRLFQEGLSTSLAMLMFSLLPGAVATLHFRARTRLRDAQTQAEAARRLAAETRLKLLEAQLEPHMLFNTLANLRALIGVDAARAQEMLDRLIAFLRATLNASRAPLHPLSAEYERLADYLALMQVRMGARLQVDLDLPPALAALPVPPLLLQPLVENAIQHGLEPQRGGGCLRVQARREGDEVVVQVSDTGIGPDAAARRQAEPGASRPGGGFGLAQVRERLAVLHGPHAHLRLDAGPPGQGGTVVTLRWPAPDSRPDSPPATPRDTTSRSRP